MSDATVERLVLVFYVWSYKLAAMLVGYLFARLGFALFLRGVTGEFKFSADIKGLKADLVSVSPGLFLILMGTIVLCVTLYKGFSVDFPSTLSQGLPQVTQPADGERPRTGLPASNLPAEPPSLAPVKPALKEQTP